MTPALALTAAIAMALVVFRAATQAITIDEATTYVLFVQNDMPFHWLGSTNNHVLNTALMRLTTRLFGVSEWSARLPALVGTAIYIVACYRFCRRLTGGSLLQWAALVCLTFSPFVMDYLVAARGYSLALGFLMTALLCDPKKVSGCIWASVAIGLCFASNFSFAFVCAATLGLLFVASWRDTELSRLKLVSAYALPATLITILISAPSLLTFPRAELTFGKHSLMESVASLAVPQAGNYSPWLLLIPGALALISLRWKALFSSVFAATLALHVAGFHLLGLLYPWGRTGVFFVPLLVGAIAGLGTRTATAALLFVAAMNVASLRLDHFEAWPFDADTDKVYSVAACLHQRHQVNRFAAGWPHAAAVNFYRGSTFGPVGGDADAPPDTEAFILDAKLNPTTIPERKLTAIWKSKRTNAVIAVAAPERFQGSACLE
jgi:4-amino-4-deoxy-L-arabinose transferase-like glycosyltransferase